MKLKKAFFRVTLSFAFLLAAASSAKVHAAASAADLFLEITRGGDIITTSSIFSYIIVLSNDGDIAAENTVVTITPPSVGMIIGTAQDGSDCLQVGDVLQCDFGSLGSNDSKTIEIQYQAADTATTMTLSAEATTSTGEFSDANNSASIDTQVVDAPSDDDDNDNEFTNDTGGCSVGGGNIASAYWYLGALSSLVGLRFSRKK